MRDAIGYLSLLDHANVRAFLHTIRVGEGTADPMGYRRHFGGTHFDSYAAHPNRVITAGLGHNRYSSSAAGAYQFLSKTWKECAAVLELRDFSPKSQDIAALFLIDRRKALDDVLAGRIEDAIRKCNREWASLPESPYGQPTRTMAQALATYIDAGGALEIQEPSEEGSGAVGNSAEAFPAKSDRILAPQEAPMPIPALPLILGLANTLIGAFAPLAREKIEKEMNRHTDNPEVAEQIATSVIASAQALTGKEDPVEATVAARADPEVMDQIQADALSTLERLAPILDKLQQWDRESAEQHEASMDSASKRAAGESWDMAKALVNGMFALLGVLILFVCGIAAAQAWKGDIKPEVWAQVAGLIGFASGVATTIYAYRFGTSRSSSAKDVVIGELSRKR